MCRHGLESRFAQAAQNADGVRTPFAADFVSASRTKNGSATLPVTGSLEQALECKTIHDGEHNIGAREGQETRELLIQLFTGLETNGFRFRIVEDGFFCVSGTEKPAVGQFLRILDGETAGETTRL